MLKIVPDPPKTTLSLEDTLLQAADYTLCALAISHHAIQLHPKAPASALMAANTHVLESLRVLIESALIYVQVPPGPRTLQ